MESIHSYLVTSKPVSFDECIAWARLKFEDIFSNQISQLLYNFPKDSITSSGTPFWSGPKRAPEPIVFDPSDPTHMSFIVAASNLHAFNYGLKGELTQEYFVKSLQSVIVPEFVPKTGVKIHVSESEAAQGGHVSGKRYSISSHLIHYVYSR